MLVWWNGRHDRLKIYCVIAWGFKSLYQHQFKLTLDIFIIYVNILNMNTKIDEKFNELFDNYWYNLRYIEPFRTLRDWYYDIRNFLFKRFDLIRTGLTKTDWHDKDQLILYGMMNLLKDYVEKEECFQTINWESDPEHLNAAREIRVIYEWWKTYENRLKEIDDQLDVWHDQFQQRSGEGLEKINNPIKSKMEDIEFEKLHLMEELLEAEEQEMLIRLIKIRKFLWT